jgi:exosortase J
MDPMLTTSSSKISPSLLVKGGARSFPVAAGVASLLAVLGLATIWSTGLMLWGLWTTDALKSIGMVVPVVSFLLVLRVWRSLGWETDGSWWGFVLLAATALVVRLREQSVMVLVLAPQWSLYFPPHSLVMFAYGVGAVLLFGGVRLLRASVFPLVLLLFVNPIPHVFNVYVDLPLQRASAHVARGFAMALGQPLSPDKLRLMFTPEFGMFIAPGCNGIRGAVTMGLIALVAGYLYRFRWQAHTAVVVGAVALGYVFNFARLCVLVLFYLVALHRPWLQDRAENADYLIGAVLFFVAVYLLYAVIQRLGVRSKGGEEGVLTLPVAADVKDVREAGAGFYLRAAAMAVLVALGCVGVARFFTAHAPSAELAADEARMGQFPQTAGTYTLVRSWNENLIGGALLFHWAEYAPEDGGTHVSIGISPVLGSHDTMICHSARGEDPMWHGETTFRTAGQPVSFSSSFYNDGATQYLETTTLCNGTSCGEYTSPRTHLGLVFSKINPQTLLAQDAGRPIPILLRAETIDTTLPAETARRGLEKDVTAFLSGIDLDSLTKPYRRS